MFLNVKRIVPPQEHLYFPDSSTRILHKEGLQQILKTLEALPGYTCYIRKNLTATVQCPLNPLFFFLFFKKKKKTHLLLRRACMIDKRSGTVSCANICFLKINMLARILEANPTCSLLPVASLCKSRQVLKKK